MVLFTVVGGIALPYIKPWSARFGIPAICTVIATLLFLSGSCTYRRPRPQGSPLTTLFRVFAASASKILHRLPRDPNDLYEIEKCDRRFHTRGLRRVRGVYHINNEISSSSSYSSSHKHTHRGSSAKYFERDFNVCFFLRERRGEVDNGILRQNLSGLCSYKRDQPQGSPLTTLFRVFAASASKIFYQSPTNFNELYERRDPDLHLHLVPHTHGLRWSLETHTQYINYKGVSSRKKLLHAINILSISHTGQPLKTRVLIIGSITLPFMQTWSILFGIPAIFSVAATYIFWKGSSFYTCLSPSGSPLTILIRVFVASALKIHLRLPIDPHRLYERHDLGDDLVPHTNGFSYKDSPVEEEEVPVEEPREDRMQPRFVVERYREVLSESYNNDDFEEVRYREVLSESYHND
ncbi:hypothetical protein L1049_008620 [Liquidambar formosana]|uniref:Uncharacterized protein n=1 Tax=Liquidambar formosana TaxID=63359 RepID=A0AAP0S9Y0_LIQFO